MVSGAITNRYTMGLYAAALAAGQVEQVEQGLQSIAAALKAHAELKGTLEHPLIGADAKVSLLRGVFGASILETVYRFLGILFKRDRSGYIVSIAEAFHERAEADRGRVEVHIESAIPLSEADTSRIKARFEADTGKQIDVLATVNDTLIAGYRVRYGNRVLDATVHTAINQFAQQLLAAGASREGTS